jgi:adenylate cyclase
VGVVLLIVGLLVAALAGAGVSANVDAQIHDRLTRLSPSQSDVPDIVLIDIDESSLAQLGPWPWPRTVVAELVKRLRDRGARVQVWDVHFPEPAAGDDVLNAVVAAPGRSGGASDTIFGQVLVLDPKVQTPPRLGVLKPSSSSPEVCSQTSAGVSGFLAVSESLPDLFVGHLTATPDVDGGLRRLPAVICHDNRRYPQLTLAAAERLVPGQPWVLQPGGVLTGPNQWLVRGPLRFALDRDGQMPIPFWREHVQWPAVTALQVLEGAVPSLDLRGRIVIVGATALGLADTVSTPFHANAPGVSVHAELMSAALTQRWVTSPPHPWLAALLVFLMGASLMVAAAPFLRGPGAWLPLGLLLALLPLAIAWPLRQAGVQWPISAPVVGLVTAALALAALQIERERRLSGLLATHLQSFLPRELASEIARQNPSGESLGRPGSGVVMAVRVVGLERWGAAANSLHTLALVHGISSLVERHAASHGGRLAQLQGETLLTIWSVEPATQQANVQDAHAARTAVESALHAARVLLLELTALAKKNESERMPLGVRISIESGSFLMAVVGSSQSRRPLLLGSAVEVALGLLQLSEELASPLLLGQAAASTGPRVTLQPMGSFLLPDGDGPQVVHRVEP